MGLTHHQACDCRPLWGGGCVISGDTWIKADLKDVFIERFHFFLPIGI